jgi:hypothetical protein
MCKEEGCKARPSYNNEGQTIALYCAAHKKEGMVDVKHKNCYEKGCKPGPSYNNEGQTIALYCAAHKKDGMVDVKNNNCYEERCKTRPSYNNEGQTIALYCAAHKKDGMVDVKHKNCKSDWCLTLVQEKYDGIVFIVILIYFQTVVAFVTSRYPDLHWIADKIVNGGCSKRRPDLLLDLGYQILIVEVDESQHIDYDCSCENKRIMELSKDLGHRPIVFIRFNPDEYEKDGENITSCWGNNKNGICHVKNSKKCEWKERLLVLAQHIDYWITPENITNKIIESVQLYYDIGEVKSTCTLIRDQKHHNKRSGINNNNSSSSSKNSKK